MTVARDIMSPDAECVSEHETLVEAARKMRDLDIGALPIRGDDNRLKGMITDRDITISCVADGADPSTVKAGSFSGEEVVTVGADEDIDEALRTMAEYQVRRLPVIESGELVGIISQADIALALPAERAGEVLAAISD